MIDNDGNTQANIETIPRFEFDNIFDINTHLIMRESNLIVHQAEFNDGGRIKNEKWLSLAETILAKQLPNKKIIIRRQTAAETLKKI